MAEVDVLILEDKISSLCGGHGEERLKGRKEVHTLFYHDWQLTLFTMKHLLRFILFLKIGFSHFRSPS
jgi:hypothetical protein